MKFEYLKKLFEATEGLSNKRQSLLKIKQMTNKDFIKFLKSIGKYIKDGKIDSSSFSVTEKIDGMSFRVAWYENKIWGESSYSGMIDSPAKFNGLFSVPFKETLAYIQKKYQKYFEKEFPDVQFKLVGELLYMKDAELDKDETVTFIATKYNPKKLGTIATYVVFDALIYNEKTKSFEPSHDKKLKTEIINKFQKNSDNNFKVLTPKQIKWNGHVDLTYNLTTKEIANIMKSPEDLLSDQEKLEKIKSAFILSFQNALDDAGSVLGTDSSVIEGIVMDIGGEGLVGFQNPEWYKLKNELWNVAEEFNEADKKFFFELIGKKTKASINKFVKENHGKFTDEFIERYKRAVPEMKKEYKEVVKRFEANKDSLPKNLANSFQVSSDARLEQLKNLDINNVDTLKQYLRIK